MQPDDGRGGETDVVNKVKTRLFRVSLAVGTLIALVAVLGAERKWG